MCVCVRVCVRDTDLDLWDGDACLAADYFQKFTVGVGGLSEVSLHCLQLLSGVRSACSLLLRLLFLLLLFYFTREKVNDGL